jgi:hypothetical protein
MEEDEEFHIHCFHAVINIDQKVASQNQVTPEGTKEKEVKEKIGNCLLNEEDPLKPDRRKDAATGIEAQLQIENLWLRDVHRLGNWLF